ncbi:hypothetical protein [Streptomyces sp. NPDC002889]|uniref:hypothetical protein n=1 Tax=Streptomyces sp. NPDC002889 TaxID=3364669 RepID=UPI0036B57413
MTRSRVNEPTTNEEWAFETLTERPTEAAGGGSPAGPPGEAAWHTRAPEHWDAADGVHERAAEPGLRAEPGSAAASECLSAGTHERAAEPASASGSTPGCPEPDSEPAVPRRRVADGEPLGPRSAPRRGVPDKGPARAPEPRDDGVPNSAAPRRGPVDPVKGLMHRHRELCERAVDPLEIAAGLEAHGVTDRTAARFRHRDVFSLAEELYARVPRGDERAIRPARAADPGAGRMLLPLLPGVVCTVAVLGREPAQGALRLFITVVGVIAATVALALCLRSGPLRARARTVPAVRIWTVWLLVFAVYGQGLVDRVAADGPDGRWPMDPGPLVALALAVAPAAWCAHLFSVRARRKLERSRTLDEFAAGTRPLLFASLTLYSGALGALLALTGLFLPGRTPVPAAALGVLLFLARLLIVHGFPEAAAAALATACAAEAAAPALLLSGRLPGLGFLARPVESLIAAWGSSAVPTLACGAVALGLLAHTTAALSRASAHTP